MGSRSSSESEHDASVRFLSKTENAGNFSEERKPRRNLPWAVIAPWMLCVALLCVIIAKAAAPVQCYWKGSELG